MKRHSTFLPVIFLCISIVFANHVGNNSESSKTPNFSDEPLAAVKDITRHVSYHDGVKKLLDQYKKFDQIRMRSAGTPVNANKLIEAIRKRRNMPLVSQKILSPPIKLNYTLGDLNWTNTKNNPSVSTTGKQTFIFDNTKNSSDNVLVSGYSSKNPHPVPKPSSEPDNLSDYGDLKLRTHIFSKQTEKPLELQNKNSSSLTPSKENEDYKVPSEEKNNTNSDTSNSNLVTTPADNPTTQTSGNQSESTNSTLLNHSLKQIFNSNETDKDSSESLSKNEENKKPNETIASSDLLSKTFSTNSSESMRANNNNSTTNETMQSLDDKLQNRGLIKQNSNTNLVGNLQNWPSQSFSEITSNQPTNVFKGLDQSLLEPANKVMNSTTLPKPPVKHLIEPEIMQQVVNKTEQSPTSRSLSTSIEKGTIRTNALEHVNTSPNSNMAEFSDGKYTLQLLKQHDNTDHKFTASPQPLNKYSVNSKTTPRHYMPKNAVPNTNHAAHSTRNSDPLHLLEPERSERSNNNVLQPTQNLFNINSRQPFYPIDNSHSSNANLNKPLSVETNMPNSFSPPRSDQNGKPKYTSTGMNQYNMLPYGSRQFPSYSYPIQVIQPSNIIMQPTNPKLYTFFQGQLYLLVPVRKNGHPTNQNNYGHFISGNSLQSQENGLPSQGNTFTTQQNTNRPYNSLNDNILSETVEVNRLEGPRQSVFENSYNGQPIFQKIYGRQPAIRNVYGSKHVFENGHNEHLQPQHVNYPGNTFFTPEQIPNKKVEYTVNNPTQWNLQGNNRRDVLYPAQQAQHFNYIRPTQFLRSQKEMKADTYLGMSNPSSKRNVDFIPQNIGTSVRANHNSFLNQSSNGQQPLVYEQATNSPNYAIQPPSRSEQNQLRLGETKMVIERAQPQTNNIEALPQEREITSHTNIPSTSTMEENFNTAYPETGFPNENIYETDGQEIQRTLSENSPRLTTNLFVQNRPSYEEYSITPGFNHPSTNNKLFPLEQNLPSVPTVIYPYVSSSNDGQNAFIVKPNPNYQTYMSNVPPNMNKTSNTPYRNLWSFVNVQNKINNVETIKTPNTINNPRLEPNSLPQYNTVYKTQNEPINSPPTSDAKTYEENLIPKSGAVPVFSKYPYSIQNQVFEDNPNNVPSGDAVQLNNNTQLFEANQDYIRKRMSYNYLETNSNLNSLNDVPNNDIIHYKNTEAYQNAPTSSLNNQNIPQQIKENLPYTPTQLDTRPNYIENQNDQNMVSLQPVRSDTRNYGQSYINPGISQMDYQFPIQEDTPKVVYGPDTFISHNFKNSVEKYQTPVEQLFYSPPRNDQSNVYQIPTENSNSFILQSQHNNGPLRFENSGEPDRVYQSLGNYIYKEDPRTHKYSLPNQNTRPYSSIYTEPLEWKGNHFKPQTYQQELIRSQYLGQINYGHFPQTETRVSPMQMENQRPYRDVRIAASPTYTINSPQENPNVNYQRSNINALPEETSNIYSYQTKASSFPNVNSRYTAQYSPGRHQFSESIYGLSQTDEKSLFSGTSESNPTHEPNSTENTPGNSDPNAVNVRSIDWTKYKRPDNESADKFPKLDRKSLPAIGEQEPSSLSNITVPNTSNGLQIDKNNEPKVSKPAESLTPVQTSRQATKTENRIVTPSGLRNQHLIPVDPNSVQVRNTLNNDNPNYSNFYHGQNHHLTTNSNSFNPTPAVGFGSNIPSNINSGEGRYQGSLRNVYTVPGSNQQNYPYIINRSPASPNQFSSNMPYNINKIDRGNQGYQQSVNPGVSLKQQTPFYKVDESPAFTNQFGSVIPSDINTIDGRNEGNHQTVNSLANSNYQNPIYLNNGSPAFPNQFHFKTPSNINNLEVGIQGNKQIVYPLAISKQQNPTYNNDGSLTFLNQFVSNAPSNIKNVDVGNHQRIHTVSSSNQQNPAYNSIVSAAFPNQAGSNILSNTNSIDGGNQQTVYKMASSNHQNPSYNNNGSPSFSNQDGSKVTPNINSIDEAKQENMQSVYTVPESNQQNNVIQAFPDNFGSKVSGNINRFDVGNQGNFQSVYSKTSYNKQNPAYNNNGSPAFTNQFGSKVPSNIKSINEINQGNPQNVYTTATKFNYQNPSYNWAPASPNKNIKYLNSQMSVLPYQSHISKERKIDAQDGQQFSSPMYSRLIPTPPSGYINYNNEPASSLRFDQHFNVQPSSINFPQSDQQYISRYSTTMNKPVFIKPDYITGQAVTGYNENFHIPSSTISQYPNNNQHDGLMYFRSMNQPILRIHHYNKEPTTTRNNYNNIFYNPPLTFQSPKIMSNDDAKYPSIIDSPVQRKQNYINKISSLEPNSLYYSPSQNSQQFPKIMHQDDSKVSRSTFQETNQPNINTNGLGQSKSYQFVNTQGIGYTGFQQANQPNINTHGISQYRSHQLVNTPGVGHTGFQGAKQPNIYTNGIGYSTSYQSVRPTSLLSAKKIPIEVKHFNNIFETTNPQGVNAASSTGIGGNYASYSDLNDQSRTSVVGQTMPQMYQTYKDRNDHHYPQFQRQDEYFTQNNLNNINPLYSTTEPQASYDGNYHRQRITNLQPVNVHFLTDPVSTSSMSDQIAYLRRPESSDAPINDNNNIRVDQGNAYQHNLNNRYNFNESNYPLSSPSYPLKSSPRNLGRTKNNPLSLNSFSSPIKQVHNTLNNFSPQSNLDIISTTSNSSFSELQPSSDAVVNLNDDAHSGLTNLNRSSEHSIELNKIQNEADNLNSHYDHLSEIFQKRIARLNKLSEKLYTPVETEDSNQNRILSRNAELSDLKNIKTNGSAADKFIFNGTNQTLQSKNNSEANALIKNQEGCSINGTIMEVGEEWTVNGVCGVYTCHSNGVHTLDTICPKLNFVEGQHCEEEEVDIQLEFPLCCPSLKCTPKNDIPKNGTVKNAST